MNKIEDKLVEAIESDNVISNKLNSSNSETVIEEIIKSLKDDEAKTANRLSLCRIPLGIAIPLTAYYTKNQYLTLGLTSMYAVSDYLDGFWAKHVKKHPTKGGAYLDAGCDKIGAVELIIPAIIQNPNLIINGALESIISKINMDSIKNGNDVHSTILGKIKMWPLSLAILCTYGSITGFKTKKFKIEKQEFKKYSNLLIPITAILELVNIAEYSSMANKQKAQKKI